MTATIISVENISKSYRLGQIGTGTLTNDLRVWWAKMRGKSNPMLRIGEKDHGNRDGETVWALKDVSFEVEQGEVLGIIGRNGAGKSTLLKILSRVTAPTTGQVKVKGRIASLLEVGTGFHPDLTGRENIYLNGAILGMSREEIRRKFDEIVAFAEVEKFIDTPVKRYSSGMYVRLAFAVAAHLDPEILLVDEVLAVGDATFQKKCLGKMSDVAGEGRTVLFVSHNMGSIQLLCRNCILLGQGMLSMQAETHECVKAYLNNMSNNNKIIDHISKVKPTINLSNIYVNGKIADHLSLAENDTHLTFELEGYVTKATRMDIEVRIYDTYGFPLAFYSPGHEKGNVEFYNVGEFHLTRHMLLPKMNRGEYIISIYLTDPGIDSFAEIPNALHIDYQGTRTATGWVFEYHNGNGWLFLPEFTGEKK